jgi:hypothetical protein
VPCSLSLWERVRVRVLRSRRAALTLALSQWERESQRTIQPQAVARHGANEFDVHK